LDIDYSRTVFIDLGSGKGRVRRSRLFGQLSGRSKLKDGSRLLV
jgi:hypothetical protein